MVVRACTLNNYYMYVLCCTMASKAPPPYSIPVIPKENRISCGISRYSAGNPVKSHDSHRTKKDHRNDLPSQERRGESCESTSPVNYKECASRPYLSYRNLQTSVGLWLPWYKSVIPCLLVVYHEYTQQ